MNSAPRTCTLGLCFALALVLAGCSMPRQDVKRYRDVLEATREPRLNVAPPAAPGEPISLKQCLALAIQNNERLGLGGEDYVAALIAKDRAWSNFLPSLSLGASRTQQQKQPATITPGTPVTTINRSRAWSFTNPPPSLTGSGTFSATTTITPPVTQPAPEDVSRSVAWSSSWNLFNGFRDVYGLKASQLGAEQMRLLLLDLERTVLLDVASAFHQVQLSEKAVAIIQSALTVQQESLREVEARERVGVARKLDVYQTKAQNADFQVQLVNAQLDVYNARQLLSFLINHPVEGPLLDDVEAPEELPPLEDLLREAIATRPDLKAAKNSVDAAEAGIQIAFGNFWPTVSLSASDVIYRSPGPIGVRWSYVLDLAQPIFRGGRTLQDIRDAYSAYRRAVLSEQALRRQIQQDIAVARAELVASSDRLSQLQVQLEAAQEALKQAKAQYTAGLAINLDVLTAQDKQLAAELQLQTEVHQRKLRYLTLRRTLGHLPLPPGQGMELEDAGVRPAPATAN